MPTIESIPERYQRGFAKLLELKEKEVQELYGFLEEASITFHPKNLAAQVAPKMKYLPRKDVESILSSIGSLAVVKESRGVSADEIVKEISTIIEEGKLENVKLVEKDRQTFRERLKRLLNIESVLCSSKSADLLTEFENVFIEARIITDLRPVFGKSTEDLPKAAMIIHNLHVHYHYGESGEHRDIYIALDIEDIQSLKDVLIRAEKKEKSIESMLHKTNIQVLSMEGNF